MKSLFNLLQRLGPGLLFAGAAIGVSHVVQSTRAGANYGLLLIGVVILINLFKFPFFEFGPRYVAATGENLLQGYKRLGNWALYLFMLFTAITMFIIMAAIVLVTSSLFGQIIGSSLSLFQTSAIVTILSALILSVGRYKTLDKIIKVMIFILTFSTIAAVFAAFVKTPVVHTNVSLDALWTTTGITFLVAFMGWMPAPIELSAWHSLWSAQQNKECGSKIKLKDACFDFHVGYWGTAVMAILFLLLGALVMHPKGEVFSNSSIAFAKQVITLYTQTLGGWSFILIAIVASATMFSTTITCLDAYCRVSQESLALINKNLEEKKCLIYNITMVVLVSGLLLILGQFLNRVKTLVDIATIMSFLLGPIFAFLNYKVVTSSHVPQEAQPSKALKVFSWIGFLFLTAFGIFFLVWRFL